MDNTEENDISIGQNMPRNNTTSIGMASELNQTSTLNPTEDLGVVTIWTIMLVYAFFANILIQIGIFRSKSLMKATSYWLIISLSVCDVCMITISLCHIIPATLWHESFVTLMSRRNIWALFFYDLFWYTGVLTLGLMAVNRFVSIVYPTTYAMVFSRDRTLQIIGCVYLAGLTVSVPTLFPCCHTVYDSHWYIAVYVPEDTNYFLVDIAVNSVSLVAMIVCYGVIIWRVRESRQALNRHKNASAQLRREQRRRSSAQNKQQSTTATASTKAGYSATAVITTNPLSAGGKPHSSLDSRMASTQPAGYTAVAAGGPVSPQKAYGTSSSASSSAKSGLSQHHRARISKRETKLFLQFFLVSMVFLLTWVTWQWLPRVGASKWIYFSLTSLFFINNGVNPTVYLIFNTSLRREVRRLFCGAYSSAGGNASVATRGGGSNRRGRGSNRSNPNALTRRRFKSERVRVGNLRSSTSNYKTGIHYPFKVSLDASMAGRRNGNLSIGPGSTTDYNSFENSTTSSPLVIAVANIQVDGY